MSKTIVAIPTFNRAKKLMAAIKSVRIQTYSNVEIWVYDNSSTDETKELIEDLLQQDVRIRYIRREINLGFSGNVQGALVDLLASDADYFTFLCDDDVLFDGHLETLSKNLDEYTSAAWWRGRQISFIADKAYEWEEPAWGREGYYNLDQTCAALSNCDMLPFWSSVLFRRLAYLEFKLPDNFYTYEYFLIHPLINGLGSGSSSTIVHMDIEHDGSITYSPDFNDVWAWQGMMDYSRWLDLIPDTLKTDGWAQLKSRRKEARVGGFFYRHGGKQGLLGNTRKSIRIARNLFRSGYHIRAVKVYIIAILGFAIGGKTTFRLANHLFMNYLSNLKQLGTDGQNTARHHLQALGRDAC